MSQTPATAGASARFEAIFQAALKSYQKQTKEDLLTHPLASQFQSCSSTTAILSIFQGQIRDFDKSRSGDERLTKWVGPTVNVLCAFSAVVSGGVSLVFSPANVIFASIGVFVLAAQGVAASKDLLAELFERIGWFFARLETYTAVAPTTAMTDIITQIMVEALRIFGIATKELRRGSTKKLLRKLAGIADVENALKRLDRLTQEEARMALAEVLRFTHNVRDELKAVDGNVEIVRNRVMDIRDKVADMGGRVEDMGDKVEDVSDRVWHVCDKVEDIGDKMQFLDEKFEVVIDESEQARVLAKETKSIIQQTANGINEIKWNQLKRLLRTWLSSIDPSKNHNIARKAQHKGTAVWLFQGRIIVEWKSTRGSLLWIHGKPGSGKSVLCSSIIQDIMAVCESGSAIMAYFYFDFGDLSRPSGKTPTVN
ncbi:hypothetical protein V8E53_002903 [Lactarius tabidus]